MADEAKPVLVHVYEVAAGLQLTARVEDPPRLIVEGEGVSEQTGIWFTVTVADAEAPVPAAFVPVTEYVAVEPGDTLPLEAEDANPVLVQLYDVAAGEQLAVRVEDPPALIVEGEGVKVHVGGWFTVTVAEAVAPVPAAFVPVTVYVAVDVGETLPLVADEAKPALLLQVNDVAAGLQLAVSVLDPPRLIVEGDADSVHVGAAFTVTVTLAVFEVPNAFVACIEYVVVVVGLTVPEAALDEKPVLVQL